MKLFGMFEIDGKHMFCFHEYKQVGEVGRFSERIDGVMYECLSETLECVKCGKRKANFIRIPHG